MLLGLEKRIFLTSPNFDLIFTLFLISERVGKPSMEGLKSPSPAATYSNWLYCTAPAQPDFVCSPIRQMALQKSHKNEDKQWWR